MNVKTSLENIKTLGEFATSHNWDVKFPTDDYKSDRLNFVCQKIDTVITNNKVFHEFTFLETRDGKTYAHLMHLRNSYKDGIIEISLLDRQDNISFIESIRLNDFDYKIERSLTSDSYDVLSYKLTLTNKLN